MNDQNTDQHLNWPRGWLLALPLLVAAVCVAALVPVLRWRGQIAEQQMHRQLLDKGRAIAETIDFETVRNISRQPRDTASPHYQRLEEQMRRYARATGSCQLWSAVLDHQDELVLGPVSHPKNQPTEGADFCPPPAEEMIKLGFQQGQPMIAAPHSEEQSDCVFAMIPIRDRQHGQTRIIIGLGYSAADWRATAVREQAIAALLLLLPVLIATVAALGLYFRQTRPRLRQAGGFRHLEAWAVAALGLWATALAALALHDEERRNRKHNFLQLAEKEARLILDAFQDVRDHKLESLVRFYQGSELVERHEFRIFAEALTRRHPVQAIAWAKPVPETARERHISEARRQGLEDYMIWQQAADGIRQPATEREIFYPLWYVEPMAEYQSMLGFDLGSHPVRRAALETAQRQRLPVATDPLALLPERSAEDGILALQPVFQDNGGTSALQGFVIVAFRLNPFLRAILHGQYPDDEPVVSLFHQVEADGAVRLLAATGQSAAARQAAPSRFALSRDAGLTTRLPLFIFGNCYLIQIRAQPAFLAANPLWQGRFAALGGGLLTLAISFAAGQAIARRFHLEQEVDNRTEQLSAILYSIGDAVIATNHLGRVTNLNPVAAELTGWSETDAQDRPLPEVFRIVNEHTRQLAPDPVERVLREGTVVGLANHTTLVARDRRESPIADSAAPIRDRAGQIIGVVLVFRDQTEERRAQRTLRESKARYRHSNRILMAIRSINQLIVREKSLEKLLGQACRLLVDHRDYQGALIVLTEQESKQQPIFNAEAGLGKEFHPLLASIERGKLPPCCQESQKKPGVSVFYDDKPEVCKDCPSLEACRHAVSLCVGLWHDESPLGYMVVHLNQAAKLTEEEQQLFSELAADLACAIHSLQSEERSQSLEDQLQQAQKMEAVGRLAGGVAHDFNNMLAIIMGNSEMALHQVEKGNTPRQELKEIVATAKRSAELTQQLLAFARKQTISPIVLELNHAIEEMLKMLTRLIGEDIKLHWQPANSPITIKLDPGQLNQILANLLVNARDSIANVGEVIIETSTVEFSETCLGTHFEIYPGRYALLAVSDTGAGMKKSALPHLFEPFFTTKKSGQGTGLGLSTVYGIVKQNEGFINVYSELNRGSTFRIYLPLHQEEENGKSGPSQKERDPTGHETVLLVEDEEILLQITERMLRQLGYRVLTAETPGQALQKAADCPDKINLLLTDVILPEMNGHDLSEQLAAQRPEMKSLFISGYTANVIAKHGILKTGIDFLEKPYSKTDLARKIREVLDNPPPGNQKKS